MLARPPSIAALAVAGVLAAVSLLGVAGCAEPVSRIEVSDAVAPVPPTPDQAVVYLRITNSGDLADELLGATTSEAPVAHLHSNKITEDGLSTMSITSRLAVPADSTVSLEAGALHIMLMEPGELRTGDTFDLDLEFRHAGIVTAEVRVVDPADLAS